MTPQDDTALFERQVMDCLIIARSKTGEGRRDLQELLPTHKDLMALISQKIIEAKREAYGHGLLTGGMPEAIGKPMAIDYLAALTTKQDTKEK